MRDYVLTLLAAAAVTYLLTPLARRIAIAVGARHAARKRDVHTDPVPLLGGLAMYGGLAAGLLVASRLPALHGAFAGTRLGVGLLLAGGLLVLIGFADDRWGLGVFSKLAGQVAAGVIVIWSGAELYWLPEPGGGPSATLGLTPDQGVVITILVVVVTINAINFIDGLDGLAAGIVGIGAAAFFVYYYYLITRRLGLSEQTGPALVSAVLAGVCLGFLPHNFHPARIFMGDTGSMLIGLLLAYAPLYSLASINPGTLSGHQAYSNGTANRFGYLAPLLVPAAILLIPYADLLLAVVRRTRAGMSPFAADKKHLQHRLLEVGHSHRRSVLIMYLWAALFAGLVVWLSILQTPSLLLVGVTVSMFALLALLLFSMPRLRPWRRAAETAARKAARGAAVGRAAALAPPVTDSAPASPGQGFLTAPLAVPGTAAPQSSFPGLTTPGGNGRTPPGAGPGASTRAAPGGLPRPARAADGSGSSGAAGGDGRGSEAEHRDGEHRDGEHRDAEHRDGDTERGTPYERAHGRSAWPSSGSAGHAPLGAARYEPLGDPARDWFTPTAAPTPEWPPPGGTAPPAPDWPPSDRVAPPTPDWPPSDRVAPPTADWPPLGRVAPPAPDWPASSEGPGEPFGRHARLDPLPAPDLPGASPSGSDPGPTPVWQQPRSPAIDSAPPWPPAHPPA